MNGPVSTEWAVEFTDTTTGERRRVLCHDETAARTPLLPHLTHPVVYSREVSEWRPVEVDR